MVIDPGNNNVNLHNSTSSRARQAAPSKNTTEANPSNKQTENNSDNVSLSSTGQAIAKIEANLVNSSEVNEAKIAEIKSAIASGRYNIDSSAIADKMLDQESLF